MIARFVKQSIEEIRATLAGGFTDDDPRLGAIVYQDISQWQWEKIHGCRFLHMHLLALQVPTPSNHLPQARRIRLGLDCSVFSDSGFCNQSINNSHEL